jgi:uncharacterized protein (TIGR02391 family)
MTKRREYPELKRPIISLDEGTRRFKVMRDKAKAMLANRPLNESAVQTWATSCIKYIQETFGEGTSHLDTFIGPIRIRPSRGDYYDQYAEQEDAEKLQKRINVLDSLIELIDTELGFATPLTKLEEDFWSKLHLALTEVAKPRFEAGHYADAVEAALKCVESKVKDIVLRKTGKELYGAQLMRTAFSPKNPIIVLEDLRSLSGRDVQEGYMEIFAGSMIGIRNPKAHDNVAITANRAIHFLFLASLLLSKIDEQQ